LSGKELALLLGTYGNPHVEPFLNTARDHPNDLSIELIIGITADELGVAPCTDISGDEHVREYNICHCYLAWQLLRSG